MKKFFGECVVFAIKCLFVLMHLGSFTAAFTIADSTFLSDLLGVSMFGVFDVVTLNHLLNFVLSLIAVTVPVVIGRCFFSYQDEILHETRAFLAQPRVIVTATFLALIYAVVVTLEGASLWLRVMEATTVSPIPGKGNGESGVFPMLLMSLALILSNFAFGMFVAYRQHTNAGESMFFVR